MNPQHKEAVKNPNVIFSSINSTAECARREAVIPACASRSGHTQFYAQSCKLCFKRGAGKGRPVQTSVRRNGPWSFIQNRGKPHYPFRIGNTRMALHQVHDASGARTRNSVSGIYLFELEGVTGAGGSVPSI